MVDFGERFVSAIGCKNFFEKEFKTEVIKTGIHYPIALPELAAYSYMGKPDMTMFANQTDKELLSLPIGSIWKQDLLMRW